MKTFLVPSHSVPLDDAWDVIVFGGGPSGCTAAASAAREGARTLLVEGSSMLGGSGTSALVPAWCPFSDKEKVIYRGLGEQVLERCKREQPHVAKEEVDWVPINAELLKRVYDALLSEHHVSVMFNTALCAVHKTDQGAVEAVLVSNKRGISALKAKVYIDCTGDADLCAWAGAQFYKGDENGDLMPSTLCFILSNVDEYAFRSTYEGGRVLMGNHPKTRIYEIIESGRFPLIKDAHVCANIVGPGTVGFNAGHLWGVDNTDPFSLSKALPQGRELARQFRDALAEFYPDAFGNAFLVMTGSSMGIRETRRIVGEYCLTLDDYIERRSFEDEVCRNCYFIDIHHALKDVASHNSTRADALARPSLHYGKGESHGVPFRSMIPKGLKNVLVAGRSISCERTVQGSIRVMPVCLAMGEAVGMAAAMLTEQGRRGEVDVRSVNVEDLRCRLRDAGAYLP